MSKLSHPPLKSDFYLIENKRVGGLGEAALKMQPIIPVKLFALTNHGLLVIGLLICVLWGVLYAEHSLNQRTQENYNNLMQELPFSPTGYQPDPSSA